MERLLSKKIDTKRLLAFAGPSAIMMVFISIYTTTGSILSGKYIGEFALAAINIVFPYISFALAVAIMYATGANAIISANLGAGEDAKARENFTVITLLSFVTGLLFAVVGFTFAKEIATVLGGTENILPYATTYLKGYSIILPILFVEILAQYFFVTVGKPFWGMVIVVCSGIVSIIVNVLLVAVWDVGIIGVPMAMSVAYLIPALVYIVFFSKRANRKLYFVKPKLNKGFIWGSCSNGSSEMVTNLAISIVAAVMNLIMVHLAGDVGLAAVSVIVQVQFLLASLYIGFGAGIAPVFGYAYGADDREQTKAVFWISVRLVVISSILLVGLSIFFADFIVSGFLDRGSEAFELGKRGFVIFSVGYLFVGMNIFSSIFFTSVSNGKISAFISFLRTFAFILGMFAIFPSLFGTTGLWISIPLAELLALFVGIGLLKKYRGVYHY